MKTVKVSVIINCYNSDKFLKQAIDSVYAQTYSDWEIIFWDNQSDDRSRKIAQSFDQKLKYFYAPSHTNLGEARHNATKKAKGKYLAFLDSDDLWHKNKLEKQIELLDGSENVGLVYGRSQVIDENNKELFVSKKNSLLPEGDIFSRLLKENFICFASSIVDREKFFSVGGFEKKLIHSTDYSIFLKLTEKYKALALQDVCCSYRNHNNNLTSKQYMSGAKETLNIVLDFKRTDAVKLGIKYMHSGIALGYLRKSNYSKVCSIVWKKKILWQFINLIIMKLFNKVPSN
tara:strand:- start:309 stop:1172 length:864 start_codon:yes stop_codon:yes gene_type:complete